MQSESEMSMRELLRRLSENQTLTRREAARAMRLMLRGECSSEEIAGFLMGLRSRRESTPELVGLTHAMREQCIPVRLKDDSAIDIVGTGGDGTGTFNISTAAAFVCAGAGVTVAKHGNRSVSSRCGSSDVLEKLGIVTDLPAAGIEKCLEETGIAFMFAPQFHTSLRHVMPVRRALGVRTCFNILGPLCNPANVRRHLVGAFSLEVAEQMADILSELGSTHVVVVHSEDGMDEVSISSPTTLFTKFPGQEKVERFSIRPEEYGIARSPMSDIRGGDADENAAILLRILNGERGPARDVVSFNAAAALYAAGHAATITQGLDLAVDALDSGSARDKLDHLVSLSRQINES